jgi:hypothetical protein
MNSRRDLLKGTGALALVAALGGNAVPALGASRASGSTPRLIGPIVGGKRGRPFGSYLGDISQVGYVEEEYFIEGEASAYEFIGAFPADGRFNLAKRSDTAPYRTRILVRRPADAARFNGTVVVEWINVSAGFDISNIDSQGLYDGFAYVSVSAQRVGVHGYEHAIDSRPDLPLNSGLRHWDAERYGSLSIPGDSLSYDIFTQAARAVGPRRTGKLDPLGGLKVRKLIAVGASQSGMRLVSYINGVQPIERVFDALMPLVYGGRSAPWGDRPRDTPVDIGPQTRIRDDLAAKVFALNSETEAGYYEAVRQPDTDRFRYWEIAGASHGGTAQSLRIGRLIARDWGSDSDTGGETDGNADTTPTFRISDVLWLPTCDAALHHVHRWINGGDPPPIQPKIEFEPDGVPPQPRKDRYGNAIGGVRLPELEVPIARYAGRTERSPYAGETLPFTREQLRSLYSSHEDYVAKVRLAAENAVKAGVILPYRAAEYVALAQAAAVP